MTQVYFPMYLTDTLDLDKVSIKLDINQNIFGYLLLILVIDRFNSIHKLFKWIFSHISFKKIKTKIRGLCNLI